MKWEYMIHRIVHDHPVVEDELNKLGEQGWEMAGCGRSGTNFDTSKILLLFFKRPKQNPPAPKPANWPHEDSAWTPEPAEKKDGPSADSLGDEEVGLGGFHS